MTLHFHIPDLGHLYFQPDQILFIEADNNNCYIACAGHHYLVPYSISTLENLLPNYFLRVHRSFLVNLHEIRLVRPYVIELTDETQLPIAQRRYPWLLQALAPQRNESMPLAELPPDDEDNLH